MGRTSAGRVLREVGNIVDDSAPKGSYEVGVNDAERLAR